MGRRRAGEHDARMNESKLPNRETPAFRTFPICLDRPQRQATLLGFVARVAADGTTRLSARQVTLPRRSGVFA
jgi:hypothetical protein